MQDCGDERREYRSGQQPDHDGVPLPGPEKVCGRPGVNAHQVHQIVRGQRRWAGAEEDLSGAEVDQHQRELDGEAEVVCDLRCDDVEAGEKGYTEGEERRRTDDGVDADDGPDGERPGEAARGGSDAQQLDERGNDARLEESPGGKLCGGVDFREWGGHYRCWMPQERSQM